MPIALQMSERLNSGESGVPEVLIVPKDGFENNWSPSPVCLDCVVFSITTLNKKTQALLNTTSWGEAAAPYGYGEPG